MSFQRMTISGSIRSSRNSEASASRRIWSPSSSSLLELDERLLHAAHALEVLARDRELLAGADDDRALLHGVARGKLDAVQAEEIRGLLQVVDHVVDLGRELEDVLAVEGRDVLRVEERDQLARDCVAVRLLCLHLLLRDARVRMLAEAALDEARGLERVLARSGKSLKNSSVRGVRRTFMGARDVNRTDSFGADGMRIAVSTACETTRERGPLLPGPRSRVS